MSNQKPILLQRMKPQQTKASNTVLEALPQTNVSFVNQMERYQNNALSKQPLTNTMFFSN